MEEGYYPHKNVYIGVVLWHNVPDVPSYTSHQLQRLKIKKENDLFEYKEWAKPMKKNSTRAKK